MTLLYYSFAHNPTPELEYEALRFSLDCDIFNFQTYYLFYKKYFWTIYERQEQN